MSDAANDFTLNEGVTRQAADGTWAGLRRQKKVLGIDMHWWVFFTVFYMNVMDGAVYEMWKIAAPLMSKDFGWSATRVTAVRGYGSWMNAALALPVTFLYERYFRDKSRGIMWMYFIQIVGELFWGVSALFMAPTRYWLYITQQLVYNSLVYFGGVAQYPIIVNWFETRRGFALGVTSTAGEGGTPVLWGILGARFIRWFGYKRAWFYASLALIPAVFLHLAFTRNWPANAGLLPWGADPKKAHLYTTDAQSGKNLSKEEKKFEGIPPAQRWGFNMREAMREPGFWLLMSTSFLSPFFWIFQANGIGFHAKTLGLSTQTVGMAVTVYGIWYMVQGMILGGAFDWKGWDYRYATAWGPLGGITIASALLAHTRSVAGYLVGYMAVAMGVAAWAPMWTALFTDTYGPLSISTVWGLCYSAATSTGVALGTILLGVAFDRWGNLYPVYNINIWTGLAAFAIFLVAFKPSLKAYRAIKNPPPWAFAKNAEAVRKNRRVVPIYD